MGLTGEVKVTTQALRQQADEVEKLVLGIQNRFSNITTVIDTTRSHWIGTGGDTHRDKYEAGKEVLEEILRRLLEHPKDLRQMAGIYEDTENRQIADIQTLPSDVIS